MEESAQLREVFLKALLHEQFAREVTSCERLGRDSNNYVYRAILKGSESSFTTPPKRPEPGTSKLPKEVNEVVLRISNPAAMLDNNVRIQNEVAAMNLAKDALANYDASIVPVVYGWSSSSNDGEGYSWILEEFRPGQPLDKSFPELPATNQQEILRQIAEIFKHIQDYSLPSTITGYGGLTYNAEGDIVSAPLTFGYGGPFPSLDEMYKGILKKQLELSDTCVLLSGWKSSDLRARLEKFHSSGISKILETIAPKRQTLIHGDFDLQNILFDASNMKITGLLDFDFSSIASPADEYFYSFLSIHGILPSSIEEGEEGAQRDFLLTGKEPLVPFEAPELDWDVLKLWYKEMTRANVLKPGDITSADRLAGLYWFLQDVCPPYFLMPRWLGKRTVEQIEAEKKRIEGNLAKYLDLVGY